MFKLDREPNPGFYPTVVKEQFPDRPMIWYDKGTKFTWTATPGSGQQVDYDSIIGGVVKGANVDLAGDMQVGESRADSPRPLQRYRDHARELEDTLDSLNESVSNHIQDRMIFQMEQEQFERNSRFNRDVYQQNDFGGPLLPQEDVNKLRHNKTVRFDTDREMLQRQLDRTREKIRSIHPLADQTNYDNAFSDDRRTVKTDYGLFQTADEDNGEESVHIGPRFNKHGPPGWMGTGQFGPQQEVFAQSDPRHGPPPPPPGGIGIRVTERAAEREEAKQWATSADAFPPQMRAQETSFRRQPIIETPSVPLLINMDEQLRRVDQMQANLNEVSVHLQQRTTELQEELKQEVVTGNEHQEKLEYLIHLRERARQRIPIIQEEFKQIEQEMHNLDDYGKTYLRVRDELTAKLHQLQLKADDARDDNLIREIDAIESRKERATELLLHQQGRYNRIMDIVTKDFNIYNELQGEIIQLVGSGEYTESESQRIYDQIHRKVQQAKAKANVDLSLNNTDVFVDEIVDLARPEFQDLTQEMNKAHHLNIALKEQSEKLAEAHEAILEQIAYKQIHQQQTFFPEAQKGPMKRVSEFINQSVHVLQGAERLAGQKRHRLQEQIGESEEVIAQARTARLLQNLANMPDPTENIQEFKTLIGSYLLDNNVEPPPSFYTNEPDFRAAMRGLASLSKPGDIEATRLVKTLIQRCAVAEQFQMQQSQQMFNRPFHVGPTKQVRLQQVEMEQAQQKQLINPQGQYNNNVARGLGERIQENQYEADTDVDMRNVEKEEEEAAMLKEIRAHAARQAEYVKQSQEKHPGAIHIDLVSGDELPVTSTFNLKEIERQKKEKRDKMDGEEAVRKAEWEANTKKFEQEQREYARQQRELAERQKNQSYIGFLAEKMGLSKPHLQNPNPPPKQTDMQRVTEIQMMKAWEGRPVSNKDKPLTLVTIEKNASFYAQPLSAAPNLLQSTTGTTLPNKIEQIYIAKEDAKDNREPQLIFNRAAEEKKAQPMYVETMAGKGAAKAGAPIRKSYGNLEQAQEIMRKAKEEMNQQARARQRAEERKAQY